jgi:hypothetical protein
MADIKDKWPWPTNIGVHGTYPEEVKALQKSPERNPDAAPMPEVAPLRLLNPTRSSEQLRMGEPELVHELSSDGNAVPLTHVVFRRVLMKARRRAALLFDDAIETEELADLPTTRRDQMRSMRAREQAMLELLDLYNGMAEAVYMRLLSESKG